MTGRILSQLKAKIEKTCACGDKFVTSYSNKIHCSRRCNNKQNHNNLKWCDVQRGYKYKINYGITLQEYNELFEEQNGCCAICKRHQSELKRNLHVDHNHNTKEIRGLLCQKCNQAIGLLNDDPVLLNNVSEYVS